MNRRDFLYATGTTLALSSKLAFAEEATKPYVMTVNGTLAADELGTTLPHEHVMVDFVGAGEVSPDRYDTDDVFRRVLPYLKEAKAAGCDAFFDCAPAYLGRDPKLLKRFADASGLHMITNTGYYGAGKGKYLPMHAFKETADQLTARWTNEWTNGIDGTGIKPGFIKIGVDKGELTPVNRKLIEAGARCHLKTGLTIASHTGDGVAAMDQLEVLKKEGVSPSAWIWVHAQNEADVEFQKRVAQTGAWIELDGLSNQEESIKKHVALVKSLRDAGSLERVLLSHDAGWYTVGQIRGGEVRGYTTLSKQFVPALKDAGFEDAEVRQLTVTNPAKAFAIGIRKA